MNRRIKLSDILIGILFTLFFISIGVIFTINFRPLYYMDMRSLHIAEYSGYSNQVILENYNALIDYNSPFFKGDFVLPSLPSSVSGTHHFKEVKDIFISFYIMCPITLYMIIGIVLYKYKKKDSDYLLASSITSLVFPILVAIGAWINFDPLFIMFHKLFFRNNDWLFDPLTDPVINILPGTFFRHCAFVIVGSILLGSLLLFIIFRMQSKRLRANKEV